MALSALSFFKYAVGTLEIIVALLSLAQPSLAIAHGCKVSLHALAALQVLGGTVLVLGAFRDDDLMLHWLCSLVFGLHCMLAISLGTAHNLAMQTVLLFAITGLVWMNIPSEAGWVERKRLRDAAILEAAEEAAHSTSPNARSKSPRRSPRKSPRRQ